MRNSAKSALSQTDQSTFFTFFESLLPIQKGFKLTFPDTRRKLLKRAIPISLSCISYITVNAHNICSFTHRFPVRLLYASQTQRCFDETGERGQTAILLSCLSSVFDRNLSTICVKFSPE